MKDVTDEACNLQTGSSLRLIYKITQNTYLLRKSCMNAFIRYIYTHETPAFGGISLARQGSGALGHLRRLGALAAPIWEKKEKK